MDKKRLQWYPAFFAVLRIELEGGKQFIQFYAEYNLTCKLMQIDVLVIKRDSERRIEENIGRMFRRYNVVGYKETKDCVSVNNFYKVIGYACTLLSNTKQVREILPSRITVTPAVSHYPQSLSNFLERTYRVGMRLACPGIYCTNELLFPIQILVIRELSKEDNIWLSRLRSGLELDEGIEVLAKEYKENEGDPLYETAMDLIMRANWEKYQEVKEMCDALRELSADELEERESIGIEKGGMEKLITLVMWKMEKGQSAIRVAEDLMEPLDAVQELRDMIESYPDYDTARLYALLADRRKGQYLICK